jgi:Tol biopolymer transport system component
MDADRTRTLAAAAVAAAALAALPAAAAGARADRGPIAFTQFDAVRATTEDNAAQVTLAAGGEPAFSPDGLRIAYLTGPFAGPYTSVAIANADGSAPRDVLRVGPGGEVVALDQGGAVTETVAHLDPGDAGDRERLASPAWSPDGGAVRIAVLDGGATRLVAIDVATGASRALGTVPRPRGAAPHDIAWSGNGRLVAFSARVTSAKDRGCTAGESRVFVNRIGTPVAWRLSPRRRMCSGGRADLRYPAFSPDGTHVLMTRIRPGVGPSGRQMDLRIVDVGTDGRPRTRARAAAPGLGGVYWATYSPDGQRIAYLIMRADNTSGIGVMAADGSDRHDLMTSPFLVLQHLDWGYARRP